MKTKPNNTKLAAAVRDITNGAAIPEYHHGWPEAWPEMLTIVRCAITAADAERQGEWAYGFGFSETANPYPPSHLFHEGWMVGWLGAQENDEG